MKKSMLLTATAIVLVGIIFCGCGEHTNAGNTPEQVQDVSQSTVFSSAVNESTEAVPTVTQQTSTVPTASSENTESLVNDSTPYDYSENEPILPTKAISENTEPTTEPPTEPKTEPKTEPLYVSDYVYSDIELEVFELINRERANAGVEPLTLSYVYADCAHVRALEADVQWSHTRPNGCEFSTVLNEYNLQDSHLGVGENLAKGICSAEQAMNALMNSPGHRENILRPEFTTVSVSAVPMSGYEGYYVLSQIFVIEK